MKFEQVLVTGGAGRLGRYVVSELSGQCRTTIFDPSAPGSESREAGNVLNLDSLARAMPGHDAVIHLGAIDSSVPAPPDTVFETNVRGTWNVLHAAQTAGVRRVVICSSSAALGIDYSSLSRPPLYLPIDEEHPLRPTQTYGLSKQLGEAMGASFARHGGMEVICLRPCWIMSPDAVNRIESERRGTIPPALPGRQREPLALLRSYVAPDDVARAFRLALDMERVTYSVFILAAADTFETEPTLPHLERVYGALPEIRKPEIYRRDPHASAYDITRARDVLGWIPATRWAQVAARLGTTSRVTESGGTKAR